MTELTEPGNAAAQPAPEWPEISESDVGDSAVAQALARLGSLPQVPVAEHEGAYNELHDQLLAALNSDPADSVPVDGDPAYTDLASRDRLKGGA
ncbi:hypothetical protein [Pseudarthrobacter sp. NamB4]|uniref:hypothetical protein n=1 Tax=Pseudarthrobacter sp. NamB4 TaxID=2576837 RepID=UPI00197AA2F4|nr:hypothetical protein [Pseudarthrobacter sp. NamB4]